MYAHEAKGWPPDGVKTRLPISDKNFSDVRDRVAHHEAGHCVAATVLGLGYFLIAIDQDGSGTFLREPPGNSRRMSCAEIEDAARIICDGWHPNPAEARHRLIELLAGPAGSFQFCGVRSGDGTDRSVAASLASTICRSNEEKQKLLAECQEEALTIVRREWPAVTTLARRLLASPSSQLEGTEFTAVLRNCGLERVIINRIRPQTYKI